MVIDRAALKVYWFRAFGREGGPEVFDYQAVKLMGATTEIGRHLQIALRMHQDSLPRPRRF